MREIGADEIPKMTPEEKEKLDDPEDDTEKVKVKRGNRIYTFERADK